MNVLSLSVRPASSSVHFSALFSLLVWTKIRNCFSKHRNIPFGSCFFSVKNDKLMALCENGIWKRSLINSSLLVKCIRYVWRESSIVCFASWMDLKELSNWILAFSLLWVRRTSVFLWHNLIVSAVTPCHLKICFTLSLSLCAFSTLCLCTAALLPFSTLMSRLSLLISNWHGSKSGFYYSINSSANQHKHTVTHSFFVVFSD